ncbi:MAG: hypothetical protein IJW67_11410 [Blautia sp.]|nr:hypothetical protein [Blautia sp.]
MDTDSRNKTKVSMLLCIFTVIMAVGVLLIAQYCIRWHIRSVHAAEKTEEYRKELQKLEDDIDRISEDDLKKELLENGMDPAALPGIAEQSVSEDAGAETGAEIDGGTDIEEETKDAVESGDVQAAAGQQEAETETETGVMAELKNEVSSIIQEQNGQWSVYVKVIGGDPLQLDTHSHRADGLKALFMEGSEDPSPESVEQLAKDKGYTDTRLTNEEEFYTSVTDCGKQMEELVAARSLPGGDISGQVYAGPEKSDNTCLGISVITDTAIDQAAYIQAEGGADYIICISGENLSGSQEAGDIAMKISEKIFGRLGPENN